MHILKINTLFFLLQFSIFFYVSVTFPMKRQLPEQGETWNIYKALLDITNKILEGKIYDDQDLILDLEITAEPLIDSYHWYSPYNNENYRGPLELLLSGDGAPTTKSELKELRTQLEKKLKKIL